MADTFKVLSILLSYPSTEAQAAAPAMKAVLAEEGLLPAFEAAAVGRFIDAFAARDLYDLQERYVFLFDRTRSLSLHLFEHVHGESRDRGQAMVDLLALYERHGLVVEARELPDYLPLFLEFLSTQPVVEARTLLSEPLHVLSAMRERLRKRDSDYSELFGALEAIAGGKPEAAAAAALLTEPDDAPDDLEALDRAWEDAAVAFGNAPDPSAGCPLATDALTRMAVPPAGAASQGDDRHG